MRVIVLWYISVVGSYAVADGSFLQMFQFPARITSLKGANVSMNCSFTLFDPIARLDVSWRRRNREGTLKPTAADNRTVVIPLEQTATELHLLNVDVQDAGVYYCSVTDWQQKVSSGNGTELIVHVPPAPVKITQQSHLTLLCTTVGFFPKEFNVTWYENETEIMSGINTTIQQNKEGLYQVSSYLSPVQNALMYTCEVSHVSLKVPAIDSYTVLYQADTGTFPKELVGGCAVAGLLLLLLVTVVIHCKLDTMKGTGITPVNSRDNSQFEEQRIQGGELGLLSYAALNFRQYKRSRKNRQKEDRTLYAQIKQGTDANLIYVSLDMTDLPKTATREDTTNMKINKPNRGSRIA
ncbi:tyrosine-protein phosphatase non-receptor type substrate 1-like isoform X1 [Hemiscyllium ocellatum]|uniref:tyrosine-protein phosphatase non-receptor type substrate 1-like isoform X1 n=1 Tax=Hemiscyllium ocellatum TaxID=170820 RepID=UPI0029660BFF|nr:tyrosine-protein phosphatase non-receptor type substrate 1-like isoform X1 [Hemiscyllium ocellatum]